MEKLHIEETAQTPLIRFDALTGEMVLKGRSIPENPDEFIEYWNSLNFVYSENFIVTSPGKVLLQKEGNFISPSAFLLLFDLSGQLNMTKNVAIKDNNIIYEGVKIELLENGKVAKVE